jgi:hypothetical protein
VPRNGRIGWIGRAALHEKIVGVDLPKDGPASVPERSEVVQAVRVILRREVIEGAKGLKISALSASGSA